MSRDLLYSQYLRIQIDIVVVVFFSHKIKSQTKQSKYSTNKHSTNNITIKIKFTITSLTILAATSISGINTVNSPYVNCCEQKGGTYPIITNSNGDTGFCKKDGINTEEVFFLKNNCDAPAPTPAPAPAKKLYNIFLLNNCNRDAKVDFRTPHRTEGRLSPIVFYQET